MVEVRRDQAAIADDAANRLAQAQAEAIVKINVQTGKARGYFITDLPGQQLIYQQKEAEARAFIDDVAPDMADYPYLDAEVGVTAATAYDVALVYLEQASKWRAAGPLLEGHRMSMIQGVAQCSTVDQVDQVYSGFISAMSDILFTLGADVAPGELP